jgi:hypothetical protein
VDRLPTNLVGEPGEPIALDELPIPLAFSKAVSVGKYIYLVGGLTDDGGLVVSDKILRAQVLDPLLTVGINVDLSVQNVDATLGIVETPLAAGGSYIYRVAAVFADDDDFNPGGESLPGEPLTLQLPFLNNTNVELSLSWNAVPDAVKYRLYRTPAADQSLFDVELLVELDAATRFFDDDGSLANATNLGALAGRKPLQEGQLGIFKDLSLLTGTAATLSTPRWGHGTAIHFKDDTTFYLYSAMGFTSTATEAPFAASDSYDVCQFTIVTSANPLEAVKHTLNFCSTFTLPTDVTARGVVDAFSMNLESLVLDQFINEALGDNGQDGDLKTAQRLFPNGGIFFSFGVTNVGTCTTDLDLMSNDPNTGELTFRFSNGIQLTAGQGHGLGFGNGVFLFTGGQATCDAIGGNAGVPTSEDEGVLFKAGDKGFDPIGASQTANADQPVAARIVYPGSLIANGRWYLVMGQQVSADLVASLSPAIQLSVPAA